jgi:peptidoglycan/LPS O-acetylase OafA/YrhL
MTKYSLSNLLSRRTSSKLIPEIDGFRFFAISTVLLYHLNTHLKRVFTSATPDYFSDSITDRVMSQGSVGVDVFFAISGFILALPFARQRLFQTAPVELKSYYIRRLTRLEPPYIISLLVLLMVHVFMLNEEFSALLPNFIASFFYVHSLVYNAWSKINPVAWSLEVEVQFYLLAPFLAIFFSIRNSIWRRVSVMLVILGSILNYNLNYELIEYLHLRKSIFMHLHQFLIGFLFADFFLTDWKELLKKKSLFFDVVGIASLTLLLVFNVPFFISNDLIFSVCLFLSFVSIFKGRLLNYFFSRSWVVIIGGMCYSIYLLHYALIAFLSNYTKIAFFSTSSYGFNYMIQFLIIIPIVLIVSSIYFVLIERPCMDREWPRKLKKYLFKY